VYCRCTLLHTAIAQNKRACISLLVDNGVDIEALDEQGRSALQLACQLSDADTVQLLLDYGAWRNALRKACMVAAVAADNAAVLQQLIDYTADGIDDSDSDSDSDNDSLQDDVDDSSNTLLHAAAALGRQQCVMLLLSDDHGYDTDDVNADGHTALDLACAAALPESLRSYDITRANWSVRKQVALLLLDAGAKTDARKLAGNESYAEAVTVHMAANTDKLHTRDAALAVHAMRSYDNSAAAAAVAVGSSAVKRFRLIDDNTGVESDRVYTYDSALLTKLHRVASADDSAGAVTLDFRAPVQDELIALLPYKGTPALSIIRLC
jgi:ankyrin repeat protein